MTSPATLIHSSATASPIVNNNNAEKLESKSNLAAPQGIAAAAQSTLSSVDANIEAPVKEGIGSRIKGFISRVFSTLVSIPVAIVKAILFIPVSFCKGVWYVITTPARRAEEKAKAELAAKEAEEAKEAEAAKKQQEDEKKLEAEKAEAAYRTTFKGRIHSVATTAASGIRSAKGWVVGLFKKA